MKTVFVLSVILTFLLSCSIIFADSAMANPTFNPAWTLYPKDPLKTPPNIIIESPAQKAEYTSTNITLTFKVIKPDGWNQITTSGGPPPPGFNNTQPSDGISPAFIILGKINSVYYQVDGGKNYSIIVDDFDHYITYEPLPPSILNFSYSLNLTSGAHFAKVGVDFESYYWAGYPPIGVLELQTVSDPINFTVTLPHPAILAPENKIYNESSVPLTFTLDDSPASWIGYSLDGENNVTIAGNSTLTGLSNGEHNVTVYANDSFGNLVASQPANFIIALPPSSKPFPTVAVASASVAVAVVCAGVILFFRKRRRYRSV